MNVPDIAAADQFLAATARVLDRRRFDRLFRDASAGPVRDAVAAYRNADGGFGHGLEPDGRAPGSQPAAIEMALRILDQADAWDLGLVTGACNWLEAHAPAEGGASFVEPTIEGWPHAFWWVPQEPRTASLIQTGWIAGTLHARGVTHSWLERATELLWSRLDTLDNADAFEMLGILRFLQHVPDRVHAESTFSRVGPMLIDRGLVALDVDAEGHVHSPLDFAPLPSSLARRLFDRRIIDAHLDHLAAGQADDGGWRFNWPVWSPRAEHDWRGFVTVDALWVLRANGRL